MSSTDGSTAAATDDEGSGDDDAVGGLDMSPSVERLLTTVGYPILRLLVALAVVWMASGVSA